jgi:hypothetical protein
MGEVCEREAAASDEANAFLSRFTSFFFRFSTFCAAILSVGIVAPKILAKIVN